VVGVTTEPIVALDYSALHDAVALVRRLGPLCRFYKIGSGLFTAAGPSAVAAVRDLGCEVFLDLKFHDIPTTVRAAVGAAAAQGARLVTVHASGGAAMLAAAVEGAGRSGQCAVVAVTVLTSLSAAALASSWGREISGVDAEVIRLSDLAATAGVYGIVCGGGEAAAVRSRHGDGLAVIVPGVRLADSSAHDQARVVTPGGARAAGARYVVVGRAVTRAPDASAAMAEVLEELRRP
jgi:orotidine-5'-phosphate decarboxylase